MSTVPGDKKLSGIRILVGRARHQAGDLSRALRELGAVVIEIPFIEIREPASYGPLDSALQRLSIYDWLILTSVNGVSAMWQRVQHLGLDVAPFSHLHIAAIGPATAKAIEKHGLRVDVIPEEYVAESVVASLRDRVSGKRVLLARAKVARDVIPRELEALGATVDVVEAYETVIPESSRTALRSALADPAGRPEIVTFTSSSSVRNFAALLGQERSSLQGIRFASIGPVTSATLRELKLGVDMEAAEFTIPGLIAAIVASRA
ncbi:MAG: uroporphyrinogen-III synthase [Acidobacteriales bacterium]|nr:uroporphyrinogen-III synthase [Terriglobales bacterium]